jgi:hypothetical protein
LLADNAPFLGNDLLVWLLLALGAAMVVGNGLALLRPPADPKKGELSRAPRGRSIVMIAVGLIAAVSAVAALTTKG